MKVNFYHGYDGGNDEEQYGDPELDNRAEPIVRKGGEVFKSCYDIEWCYHVCHVIDPARSLAKPVADLLDGNIGEPHWTACDMLSVLIADMGINRRHPSLEDAVAFWTMFPDGVSEALSNCYMKDCSLLAKHGDIVRILNNPFFYKDRNANERRLVEIAEDSGLRFALDRIAVIPGPETIAREIAILNHGIRDSNKVEDIAKKLTPSIAKTMEEWELKPTVGGEIF